MVLDHYRLWRSVPVMLALGLTACTTNPDGTVSTNKTIAGTAAGAIVGLGVGVAIGGSTDKKRTRNAMLGAAAGAAVGTIAGATLEYFDQEIEENNRILSDKTRIELEEIDARIRIIEQRSSANYQDINRNNREMAHIKNRYEQHDQDLRKLVSHHRENEIRKQSTSEAIEKISYQIESTKNDRSAENRDLINKLQKQREKLETQDVQLSKQKRVITGLLATINQQNKMLARRS